MLFRVIFPLRFSTLPDIIYLLYSIFKNPYAFDLTSDHITFADELRRFESHAYSRRSSGSNYRSRQQSYAAGKLFDYSPDISEQHIGIAVLPQLSVDPRPDPQSRGPLYLIFSNDTRTDGGECIQTLSQIPLFVISLQITSTHVIQDRISENIFSGLFRRDVFCLFSDHDCQLDFIVQFFLNIVVRQHISARSHCLVDSFRKIYRIFLRSVERFLFESGRFFSMSRIVDPQTDDILQRSWDRREKFDISKSDRFVRIVPPRSFPRLREWLDIIAVAMAVAFGIRGLFLQPFKIPTGSMQPTLYGIHAEDAEGPDLFDTFTPLKVLKWAAIGRWYRDVVAKRDGSLAIWTDHVGAPGYVLASLAGETFKIPQDAMERHENELLRFSDLRPDDPTASRPGALRGTVRRGDRVWRGYVVSGDQVFVNRFLWYLRPPKRDEIVVFSTSKTERAPSAAVPAAPAAPGKRTLHVPFFGFDLALDETPIPGLMPGMFYIKRLVGLPGERV